MKAVTRARLDREGDVLDGEEVAVVDVEVVDFDALGHGRRSFGWRRQRPVLGANTFAHDARDEVQDHDDEDQGERAAQARSR